MGILGCKKNGCLPHLKLGKPKRKCCPSYEDEPHDPECGKPDAYWLHMPEPNNEV